MARERLIEKDYDVDSGTISFEALKTGMSVKAGDVFTIKLTEFSKEAQEAFPFHGAIQKIGDNYAGAAGDVDKAWSAMKDMVDQLKSGWKGDRAEGGIRLGLLAEAIAQIKGLDVDQVRATLAGPEAPNSDASEEEKAEYTQKRDAIAARVSELKKHPTVKRVIAEIQAARLKAESAAAGEVVFSL